MYFRTPSTKGLIVCGCAHHSLDSNGQAISLSNALPFSILVPQICFHSEDGMLHSKHKSEYVNVSCVCLKSFRDLPCVQEKTKMLTWPRWSEGLALLHADSPSHRHAPSTGVPILGPQSSSSNPGPWSLLSLQQHIRCNSFPRNISYHSRHGPTIVLSGSCLTPKSKSPQNYFHWPLRISLEHLSKLAMIFVWFLV